MRIFTFCDVKKILAGRILKAAFYFAGKDPAANCRNFCIWLN